MTPSTTETVARFFAHLTAREWNRLGTVLSEEVVRIGPFGDRLSGRDLFGLPPRHRADGLPQRRCPDHRCPDGSAAFATVTEHLRYDDQEFHLDEAYSFDLDEDGRICRVEIYWQTPRDDPGGFGSATSGDSYAPTTGTEQPGSSRPRGLTRD